MMRIGKLDRRISIERATETVNDYGERELSWSVAFLCWASLTIKKTGSAEKIADGYERAEKMAEWTLRHSSNTETMTVGDRIAYKGTNFDIIAIHELERGVDIRVITETIE